MYEGERKPTLSVGEKAAEKYIADFMPHVRDEDFGDAWIKMHPASDELSPTNQGKINAALKAERERRSRLSSVAGEK